MPNKPVSRRKIFIKRSFQGRFIAWIIGLIIVFGLCSAFIVYALISSDLTTQSFSAHVNIENTWQRLGLSILVGNIISAVIAILMSIIVVLYISHKIAGPLYRLEQLFLQVGNGDYDVAAQLRSSDQLLELLESFQHMTMKLKKRRDQQHRLLEEINHQLNQTTDGERIKAIQSKLKQLEDML